MVRYDTYDICGDLDLGVCSFVDVDFVDFADGLIA